MHDPPSIPTNTERLLDDITRQLREATGLLAQRIDALPPDLDEVPPVVVDEEADRG